MKIKHLQDRKEIDLTNYVNTETGEELISEMGSKAEISVCRENEMVSVESNDYSVIETNAVLILSQVLNRSDLGNVLKMAVTTKTEYNVLFNHNTPHSNKSLQKYLQLKSESKFFGLIKRLIKAGVLYQIKGKIYGKVRTCYMINPYLSRKRVTFQKVVFEAFEDFNLVETSG